MAAVPRQDPIEVSLVGGEIAITQEQIGETEEIYVAPENAERLIDAIRAAVDKCGKKCGKPS